MFFSTLHYHLSAQSMAKKKEKTAAKEETVQAVEGELDDEDVGDDNSPGN